MADTKKPDPDNAVDPETEMIKAEANDSGSDTVVDDTPDDLPDAEDIVERAEEPETANEAEETAEETTEDPPVAPDAMPPEPTPSEPEPTPREPARRGGFVPALIGGVLAASLGFLAARTEVLDPILPASLKSSGTGEAVAALQATDTKQAGALAALRAEIAAIDQPDLGPVTRQLAAIQLEISSLGTESQSQKARLADFAAAFEPLNARLGDLEKRPMTEGASDVAIAAYDRELATLRKAIAAQRADVEKIINEARATEAAARALEQSAASAARQAQNQATVTRLSTAVDNGAAYAAILAELHTAGVAVPDVLNASAKDGVATLSALNDTFPTSARLALSVARADEGGGGGIKAFLQRHTSARSVQPREGDDPDAVLSRAEAAVTAGDLAVALNEIAALPDAARAKMQGWADSATTRLTALKAAEELAQSLNTN